MFWNKNIHIYLSWLLVINFFFLVHLIGKYNDKVFEERHVQFALGEGQEFGIVEGIERALEKFSSGEKSRLKIASKFAFKDEGKPEFGIPPNADVEYTIRLINFEKV